MAQSIPVGMKAPFTVGNFKDAQGNPASVDPNTPITSATMSDPAVADVVDLDQATIAGAVRALATGSATLTVTIDVDVTSGVKDLPLTADITVPAGEATTGDIVFGTPVPA